MEFEEAQCVFESIQGRGKIIKKIEQKLDLLSHSIQYDIQPDIATYDQLEEDDCNALIKLNKQAQIRMFCEIISQLANQFSIPCSLNKYYNGEIDIRTKTLKQWKSKKFIIDVDYKTFEIVRKNKQGIKKKDKRIIQLQFYELQPKVFADKRFRFQLTSIGDRHGYYRSLVCGSTDQKLCEKVMDVIRNLAQYNSQMMKASIIIPDRSQAQSFAQSQYFDQPKQQSSKSLIQPSKQPNSTPQKDTSPVQTQQSPPQINIVENKSSSLQMIPEQLIKPQQIQQDQEQKVQQQQPQQPPPQQQPIVREQPQIQNNSQQQKQVQLSAPKQEEKEVFPVIFQQLVDEEKLSPSYFQKSTSLFTEQSSNFGIQILKSSKSNLCFRVYVHLSKTDIEKVFQCLAEIEFIKKWNGIVSQESRVLSMIGSEQSGIIYQKHKQYGMLYRPRDYVFIRYVSKRKDSYIIVDKSIDHEDAQTQMKVVRGFINYQIIEVKEDQNEIRIIVETEMTNGGLQSASQDSDMTLWYLQEYKQLSQFVKIYNQQQIIMSPLLSALQTHAKVAVQEQEQEQEQQQQFVDLEQSQIQQLEQIPDIQHEPEVPLMQRQQSEQVDEFVAPEIDDDLVIEQQNFTPEDVISNTLPNLSVEEQEKVRKLISIVEQEKHYNYCLQYKYQQEPQQAKDEYITSIDDGHYFLRQDWERDKKNGGMLFINQKKVEAQKRVIKFMLKMIGSNLLSGKSILSISLPVEIFETRSNLERFAYSFGFAPRFLEEGARLKTPEQQMKQTLTFGMSAIIMYLSLEKPFNPILGETYQGIINGCPVYCEQVSHHPPVCAFQFKGRGYEIDGHIESVANMHANSVTGKNVGYIRVTYYNTGAKQLFIQCPGSLSGTAFGQRVFNLSGKQFGIDLENKIVGDLMFNPGKSSLFGKKDTLIDQFEGAVYKVRDSAINKYRKEGYAKYGGLDMKNDIEQEFYKVRGVWNEFVEIDGVKTFDLEMLPYKMINHPNPLPSDANYRVDILWWKLKDFDKAQKAKEDGEVKQRLDRKFREKMSGKKH